MNACYKWVNAHYLHTCRFWATGVMDMPAITHMQDSAGQSILQAVLAIIYEWYFSRV